MFKVFEFEKEFDSIIVILNTFDRISVFLLVLGMSFIL